VPLEYAVFANKRTGDRSPTHQLVFSKGRARGEDAPF
jgi:hypothetical protein